MGDRATITTMPHNSPNWEYLALLVRLISFPISWLRPSNAKIWDCGRRDMILWLQEKRSKKGMGGHKGTPLRVERVTWHGGRPQGYAPTIRVETRVTIRIRSPLHPLLHRGAGPHDLPIFAENDRSY